MTVKVHGAAYPGMWVERNTAFIKITFSTAVNATLTYSAFGVVESAVVQALKTVALKATILGVTDLDSTGTMLTVFVGHAEGWFAPLTDGVIATAVPVTGAAENRTVPTAPVPAVYTGTYNVNYAKWDGNMPLGTGGIGGNGAIANGPGATSGAYPATSPTGTPGYYSTL